ncbi:MAG: hypothetical protein ACOC3T_00830 [Bacteroidota bacterium]
MNTQKEELSTIKSEKNETIMLKKYSTPSIDAKQIYGALGYKENPYYLKKSVIPE